MNRKKGENLIMERMKDIKIKKKEKVESNLKKIRIF